MAVTRTICGVNLHAFINLHRESRRLIRLGELFTESEVDHAYRIWRRRGGAFNKTTAGVIAEGAIEQARPRLIRDYGQADPVYLAYLLMAVFDQLDYLLDDVQALDARVQP